MGRKRLAKNRNFPANLYQNAAGYFYYVDPDSRKRKGIGKDRSVAFAHARAGNAVVAMRTPSTLVDWLTGRNDYSLADWIPIYRELWVKMKKPAAGTLRNVGPYLDQLAQADFAWRKLPDVTTAHIADFIKLTTDQRGASTAMHMRTRLADIFRMAETQGLIPQGANPVTATYTPEREVKRERLTMEQFLAIRALAPTWMQRGMDLALLTGQRRDDITNMKFADVKDGYLHVIQGKSQGDTRLRLDLRIGLEAAGMTIGDAVRNCRDMIVSRYMVHQVTHAGPSKPGDQLSENSLSQGFMRARDAAGIVAADGRTPPTFHEIRSLAERLYRDQYGQDFAQSMLGHKNAKTTAKYDDLRGQGWKDVSLK